MTPSFENADVEAVFNAYPDPLKAKLMNLRQLIFETAAQIDGVGPLQETLKWGQPSYLTPASKSGTTIRIDQIKSAPGQYGMFVHCQTSLLPTYRDLYLGVLNFEANRGVRFTLDQDPPRDAMRHCIALALTYHRK